MCQLSPECTNPVERNGSCASCNRAKRKAEALALKPKKEYTRIKPATDKLAKARIAYKKRRDVWIVGKRCAVYPHLNATQCHHKISREHNQFADQWARDRNISLLHDERFWLPVSDEGHDWINNNTELALELGFSELRLSKK